MTRKLNEAQLKDDEKKEPSLWSWEPAPGKPPSPRNRVQEALDFWEAQLGLREAAGGEALSTACKGRLVRILRAMSWTESLHGSGSGPGQPKRDPIQCGNPDDSWWKELTKKGETQDNLVAAPGLPNFHPKDHGSLANVPEDAKIGKDLTAGHNDPKFTPAISYFWAVPYFLYRSNQRRGRKTYQCGKCDERTLVDGAVRYNGKGDAEYRQKITRALQVIDYWDAHPLPIP